MPKFTVRLEVEVEAKDVEGALKEALMMQGEYSEYTIYQVRREPSRLYNWQMIDAFELQDD